ncbi:peptide chain release factor 3 [Aquisalinus flavus]|uniref:Peptide chain release factor 3 n=1 Tax=Aquisalinus flavus TaxID=1526572 RepID=A0A8J2Y6X1_9PROT|nr:peptide chain release factor 3 [Aquisalinus flavus]MBD0425476.1 peptide chain release factor 3 [Aquisalinus flavus]UNE48890.1 peptide chain release factor 3 [Aquisalinus flavus]GGD15761.1 peptide chain release factor 3 [Aquisalinus flavus]
MSADTQPEWQRRRTFAIIAHPDAGKTTLTERLLLEHGAIRMAGDVKARGERRRTRSDWMEMEQKRGISVSSSVMTFESDKATFNLLDTPGHEDFSEDTYRTLTAVDSAIMVIDAAKGIESQTLKLLEVCRLRDIPIITFINKIDREARDAFELLDEIEATLALDLSPVTWPVGMGPDFQGCYDLVRNRFDPSAPSEDGTKRQLVQCTGPDDEKLDAMVKDYVLEKFREDAALAVEAYKPLDPEAYRQGHMSPVLFGSALKKQGVASLLNLVETIAPAPRPQPAEPETVRPEADYVSGFVFKVQANMDPNHRDRVAFLRLCSGNFKRGMKLKHMRTGKPMAIQNPIFFFAQEREITEEAMPGDIIGIPNHGTLRVGDTLTSGPDLKFTGIPSFAPEILRRVRLDDPLKAKQLNKALTDLAEEGVVQVFAPMLGADQLIGVVGQLQLDVLTSRLGTEYKIAAGVEPSRYQAARWLISDDKAALKKFIEKNRANMAEDRDGAPVFLAPGTWEIQYAAKNAPEIRFSASREVA